MGANKSLLTPQCANKSLSTHSGVPITPTTIKFIIIALTDTEDHLPNIQSQGIGELPQENGKSDNSEVRFNLPVNGVFPKGVQMCTNEELSVKRQTVFFFTAV